MQIWIYFEPGAGGDGVANLFEHSNNVLTVDHDKCVHASPVKQYWRVDRVVDNRPKFWAPCPDKLHCFRHGNKFDKNVNLLSDTYIDLVMSDANIIVTSHDCSLRNLEHSDHREIFTKNQVKILLQSTNRYLLLKNAFEKNLKVYSQHSLINSRADVQVKLEKFDHVINVDNLLSSWDSVKNFTKSIGLDLSQQFFDEFRSIQTGSIEKNLYSDTTPRYKTIVDCNGIINYQRL